MSIDMLQSVQDKRAALSEVARLLRPGGRFVLTPWEGTEPDKTRYHQALFEDAGFAVDECYEKPDWERRQRAVYEKLLEEQAAIVDEMGAAAARPILNEARRMPSRLAHLRHLFMIGRKV